MAGMSRSDLTPFETALAWIFQAEGGHSDHAADSGGKTAYGISQYHPAAWADGEVTRREAAAIYKRDYWDGRGCDRLPLPLGVALFDGEVNHRPRTASRLLQSAIGVTVDGYVGPKTAAAARAANPAIVLDRYLARRAELYQDIVKADSSQAAFIEGWYWRLFRLHRYCIDLSSDGLDRPSRTTDRGGKS